MSIDNRSSNDGDSGDDGEGEGDGDGIGKNTVRNIVNHRRTEVMSLGNKISRIRRNAKEAPGVCKGSQMTGSA